MSDNSKTSYFCKFDENRRQSDLTHGSTAYYHNSLIYAVQFQEETSENPTLKSGVSDSLTSGKALIQVHTLLNIRGCKHKASNHLKNNKIMFSQSHYFNNYFLLS